MKKSVILFSLIIFIFNITAQQLSKVYVLSEGGFSPNTSRLSLLDLQSNQFSQSIFSPGNIGLYPDGLILFDNHLFLTEQGNFGGSGKIYKLDTLGNVLNSAVVGTNPYSLTISNDKIYVTNGPASNVSVLNLNDLTFIKNISVGVYPQEIISFDGKIFVANNSLFGGNADSTVSVIDPSTDSVIATITVKKDPSSFAISNDNQLLIGCPGDANNGKIFKVNPQNYHIIDTFSVPVYGFGKDICVDKNSNDLYFISYSNDIVKFNLDNRQSELVLSSVYPNNFYYGYNFDYTTKRHFVADAKSFTVEGSLIILDSTYNQTDIYATGIAPRRILFKYNEGPSDVNDNLIADKFTLEQNYPNPFNPSTKIRYSIPNVIASETKQSVNVSLKVYDVLGNEVATLLNEPKQAGTYEIEFNAGNLPSGTYFYKLSVGEFSVVKKMLLIK